MKKFKLYAYQNCSTCKQASKFLDQHKVSYEPLPIVDCPPSKTELKQMLEFLGGDIRQLFNRSGQLYRELKIKDRIDGMSESEALELLSRHGKLVKRPFLLGQKFGTVGFNQAAWEAQFT
jgi:Spx/MgsR family transcriptional regulator